MAKEKAETKATAAKTAPAKATAAPTAKKSAEVKAAPKTATKAEAKTATKTEAKAAPKAETKTTSKSTKTEVKAAPKAEAKVAPKTETKTAVKAETKATPKTEAKVAPKAETKTAAKTETKAETKAPDKENVKEAAPEAPVKEAYTGKFVIKKTDKGNFVFKLFSSNGRTVAIGTEPYATTASCKTGIQSVVKFAATAPIEDQTLQKVVEQKFPKWVIRADKKGEFRLRLYASNGNDVAATNDGYTTKDAAKKGIDVIARAAKNAEIIRNDHLW
ncbi:MAG: DUF1508 domain-containing protein [Clostridia bacterium]|nr:DUF1508 domain-containing protein [Clostridia bacterium]